jgi:hypothetical protein
MGSDVMSISDVSPARQSAPDEGSQQYTSCLIPHSCTARVAGGVSPLSTLWPTACANLGKAAGETNRIVGESQSRLGFFS